MRSQGPTAAPHATSVWVAMRIILLSVFFGLLMTLIGMSVWSVLLHHVRTPLAAAAQLIFLGIYIWWASGGGPPRAWVVDRTTAFRKTDLQPAQWAWGLLAAFFFAIAVHASIVLLFRFIPFPREAFRRGHDFSFIPTLSFRWLAVLVSALSAGVVEETGFRGYLQTPIEQRFGAKPAVLISSIFFTLLPAKEGWEILGMVPIVLGAGLLLGLLACASRSLIPGIVGHIIMDIGLFAYWWTGIAGDFTARPISETGVDRFFVGSALAFATSLSAVLFAIRKLGRMWTGSLP